MSRNLDLLLRGDLNQQEHLSYAALAWRGEFRSLVLNDEFALSLMSYVALNRALKNFANFGWIDSINSDICSDQSPSNRAIRICVALELHALSDSEVIESFNRFLWCAEQEVDAQNVGMLGIAPVLAHIHLCIAEVFLPLLLKSPCCLCQSFGFCYPLKDQLRILSIVCLRSVSFDCLKSECCSVGFIDVLQQSLDSQAV